MHTYQLEAFTAYVREGVPRTTGSDDAMATTKLIDQCYRAIGLERRPRSLRVSAVNRVWQAEMTRRSSPAGERLACLPPPQKGVDSRTGALNAADQILALPATEVGQALAVVLEDQWFERTSIRIAAKDFAIALVALANAEGGTAVIGLHGARWRESATTPAV